jgi:pyrroloquinoline-quinone-dependent sugar dehydrogenase TrAA12-like protein
MKSHVAAAVAAAGWCAVGVQAQTKCSSVLVPTYTPPAVAAGWTAQLVVNNVTTPRSLSFDSEGNLLVVERTKGVSRITFKDNGGTCLEVSRHDLIIDNPKVCPRLVVSLVSCATPLTPHDGS